MASTPVRSVLYSCPDSSVDSFPNPKFKQNAWQLDQVLPLNHQVNQQFFINAPLGVVQNFRVLLSRDVFSEGDSQFLYDYLMSRSPEMSSDFLAMLQLWLEDELKHYEALRRTYHCLAGVGFAEMDYIFKQRSPDMEPIQMLLQDEFTILVTLMFDEIGSVYSYRRDLAEYYRYFGKNIRQIGHHLVKDEGSHFSNAAEILLSNHVHRLPEVKGLLREIVALEKTLDKYHKSFFLDHAQEQHRFPPNFNQLITQVVLARLGLDSFPPHQELKQLWQWTPEGLEFTPI